MKHHSWWDIGSALTVVLIFLTGAKGDYFFSKVAQQTLRVFSGDDFVLSVRDILWIDPMALLFSLLAHAVAEMSSTSILVRLPMSTKIKDSFSSLLGHIGWRVVLFPYHQWGW